MRNMTLPDITAAVEGKLYIAGQEYNKAYAGEYAGMLKKEAESVVIDSRRVKKDGIFVAIKGERNDGHEFIDNVLEAGALGVICSKLPENSEKETRGALILVDDTLLALKKLAAYYRKQIDAKIVGIVGSVGKTSTKELVASVLSQNYKTCYTEGNLNNEIGVPLTLFRITAEHEMAVVEMGISDFGEMDRLGTMVKPDAVVMTNIGPCHLEKLGDLDGVLKAKSEVLNHIKPGGLLILNTDDEKLRSLQDRVSDSLKIAGYGSNGDVSYENVRNLGVEGSRFCMKVKKGFLGLDETIKDTHVNMQGTHMVMNSLAACIAGLYFGMDMEKIAKGIEAAKPVKGRCCPNRTDRYLVVDDSYNANPKSMMAAIDLMDETEGRKVLILGDMFELGENEKQLHREVGEYAAGRNVDLLVCVGELSQNMYEGFMSVKGTQVADGKESKALYYKTREELFENIDSLGLTDGDVILVKASHGMGFAEVVEKLVEKGTKFRFVKGREFMRVDDIMKLLSQTHWACNRSRETVEKSIENSLCFGIIDEDGKQVGFGRTVTDYATMFYVSDVVVDKDLQKHGLGRRFVEFIKSAPELEYLWGFLGTTKAKGFYEKCGFEKKDDFFMAMPKTEVKGIFKVK
jgi:UDP-N-acetylmuramoyl-tripeptide--D-alanyl-D-alanine ligase